MVKRFTVKKLFNDEDIAFISRNFGLNRMDPTELCAALENAFHDYIFLSLSEMGEQPEDRARVYLEAQFHIDKSAKLLQAMPHPAGKMSYRLGKMSETLKKLIEGNDQASASRAARFVEKNLVRKLRDVWLLNTATPFHAGIDDSGSTPNEFLLYCFEKAYQNYPEIEWFNNVNQSLADTLIKSVKKGSGDKRKNGMTCYVFYYYNISLFFYYLN